MMPEPQPLAILQVTVPAVAGGLELACWADLRVAPSEAVFGVYCRRWGVPLVDGATAEGYYLRARSLQQFTQCLFLE